MISAREEYLRRLDSQRTTIKKFSRIDTVLSTIRGILFVGFILLAFYLVNRGSGFLWIALPVVVFGVAIVIHEKVIDRKALASRIADFYERGLARLEHRWMGKGSQGKQFQDLTHPYSEDLDIFGSGSLYELLCIARTHSGEQTLASWLLHPAMPHQIRSRQEAVKELQEMLDFRENLASLGSSIQNRMHPDRLVHWAEAKNIPIPRWLQIASTISVAISLLTLLGWGLWGWGWNPFVTVLILQIFLMRNTGKRVLEITKGAEGAHEELKLLSILLERFEKEKFKSGKLIELQAEMKSGGIQASRQIQRMGILLELLDWQRNQLFAPVAILLLWQAHLAFALEKWRIRYGNKIRSWISGMAEMEALQSLACYSFEHPADPFPEVIEGDTCYEGLELGHPLIPESHNVRNSMVLNSRSRLKIVSGSNMSGKSTFLRTVGINAVLALCGAVVRAKSLRISPVSVGASIHILDSLQAGSSRFYAEITRLRQIMDLAQNHPPVLFLLDEILHGTNSADRLIGAEAIVRGFLRRNAIGLLTTHDLALTAIGEKLGDSVENIHFQDHIEDGKIAFDYRVHPGIVQKSNAIALMRAVGLEV